MKSDKQLNKPMATEVEQALDRPTKDFMAGRDTPLTVRQSNTMEWLGAEGGVHVPHPEGGSNVSSW